MSNLTPQPEDNKIVVAVISIVTLACAGWLIWNCITLMGL